MSIDKVIGSLGRGVQETLKPSFSLPNEDDFVSRLTVGQIIKGRVLRHFDGNRYLVSFSGQEKVVDSVIALRTDDVIHGKVIGVGERVELQRVRIESAARETENPNTRSGIFGRGEKLVDDLFQRYLATLSATDRELLLQHVKAAPDGESAARAGLILNKLGIALHPELLQAVLAVLTTARERGLFQSPATALHFERVARTDGVQPTYTDIANAVAALLKDTPQRRSNDTPVSQDAPQQTPQRRAEMSAQGEQAGTSQGDSRYDLGRWILNVQTEGMVAHRLGSFMLRLGNQLVEIDMALFEQRRQSGQKDELTHRQIVFALDLERLGRVEVTAKVAGDHLRVRVANDEPAKTDLVAHYLGELRRDLEATGWHVDEVSYETRREQDGVVRAVVEHIASQDSLSRLL